MTLRERILVRLRKQFEDEPLSLRLVFWDGEVFDFSEAPTVMITFRDRSLVRLLLTGQMARLGDAYADGRLGVDGPVHEVLQIGMRLAERLGKTSKLAKLARPFGRLLWRHSRAGDAAAIRHHYDISDAFYALWLDRSMTYSCAYFHTGEEDIDAAQEQKIDHICRKLRLTPGCRLLDIGCGWGGLLRFAAKHYGITGLGVTNSESQYRYARERARAEKLDGLEFRLQDYRDLAGTAQFDRIVSVGMYEHVGLARLPGYFAGIAKLLRPGGIVLNHGIIVTDPNGPKGPPGGEFIDRHVFPGGELPHLSRVLKEFADVGLEVVDTEDLRPHYARTLFLWVTRLEARRDEAIALVGPERFRIWRIYLAGMAHAFDMGWLSVAQVIAYQPLAGRPAPRPWTRGYQYGAGSPLVTALDWNARQKRDEM